MTPSFSIDLFTQISQSHCEKDMTGLSEELRVEVSNGWVEMIHWLHPTSWFRRLVDVLSLFA